MLSDIFIGINFSFIVISFAAVIYWRRRLLMYTFRKMVEVLNLEDLIGNPEDEAKDNIKSSETGEGCKFYRERIAAAISGGNAINLLRLSITQDIFLHMSSDKINTLYVEYTVRMG